MTSLPASRMRLPTAGIVRPGMAADLVAFDPDDGARPGDLRRPAALQRGHPLRGGERPAGGRRGPITEARPGRVLRGPGYEGAPSR